MHPQLSWSSAPAHIHGFKDLFDRGDPSQGIYLLLGLHSLEEPLGLRHMGQSPTALPSSDFPCTPSPRTSDQAWVAQTHISHAAYSVKYFLQAKKERRIDLKKKKKEKIHTKGKKGRVDIFLTIGCDFVGGVEACISAGWSAHVQMEQDVLPQPVASLF